MKISEAKLREIISSRLSNSDLALSEGFASRNMGEYIPDGMDSSGWEQVVDSVRNDLDEKMSSRWSRRVGRAEAVADVAVATALFASGESGKATQYIRNAGVDVLQSSAQAPLVKLVGGALPAALIWAAIEIPMLTFESLAALDNPYWRIIDMHRRYREPINVGEHIEEPQAGLTDIDRGGVMQNPLYGLQQDVLLNDNATHVIQLMNPDKGKHPRDTERHDIPATDKPVLTKRTLAYILQPWRDMKTMEGVHKQAGNVARAIRQGIDRNKAEKIKSHINGFFSKVDSATPSGPWLSDGNFDRINLLIDKLSAKADEIGIDKKKVRKIVNLKVDDAGWGGGTGNENSGLGGYFWHRGDVSPMPREKKLWTILAKRYKKKLS